MGGRDAFAHGPATVIIKPSAGSQGKGISLARSSQELLSAIEMLSKPDAIVQAYIDRPLLLDGHKWDARVYALVLLLLPLDRAVNQAGEAFACFLACEGLVRVCVDPYEQSASRNLHRSTSHLTNYSLSKVSEKYVHNEDPTDAERGTRRSLAAVLQKLEGDGTSGVVAETIWQKLGVLVRATMDAVAAPLQATAFDPSSWDGSYE